MHVGSYYPCSTSPSIVTAWWRRCGSTASMTGSVFHPDNELVREASIAETPGRLRAGLGQPADARRRRGRRAALLDEPGSRFRGVKLHPAARRLPPRRPHRCTRSSRCSSNVGCPALIHCGHPIFTLPWSIEELIRRYPRRIASSLATWATGISSTSTLSIDVAARNPNVYLETSGMPMHTQDQRGSRARRARPGPVWLGCSVPSPVGGAREGARERTAAGPGRAGPGRERPQAVLRLGRSRTPSS